MKAVIYYPEVNILPENLKSLGTPAVQVLQDEELGKNFRITPYIYYACRIINYVCALLFWRTIATPEGIEYIH